MDSLNSRWGGRMSAFGGKADMAFCGGPLFAVAIGGKADMAFCAANVRF